MVTIRAREKAGMVGGCLRGTLHVMMAIRIPRRSRACSLDLGRHQSPNPRYAFASGQQQRWQLEVVERQHPSVPIVQHFHLGRKDLFDQEWSHRLELVGVVKGAC